MRLVDRPVFTPMRCAAVPFVGQSHESTRWVDCGVEMSGFDNHIYLSDVAVREAATLLGYPTPEEHAGMARELNTALEEQLRLLDELAALSKYKDAVDEIRAAAA